MRIVKEVQVDNPRIEIQIDPNNQKTSMALNYTCPDCAGWGCGRHGGPKTNRDCNGGTVHIVLDPSKLDQTFEGGQLMKIKAAIQNLYLEVIGD